MISGLCLNELMLPLLSRGLGRGTFSHQVVTLLRLTPRMTLDLLPLVISFSDRSDHEIFDQISQ